MATAKKNHHFLLSDGTKGRINKAVVSLREWRDFWKYTTPDDANDALLARASGLSQDYIQGLMLHDYQRLAEAFRRVCISSIEEPEPVEASKNSASEST